MARQIGATLIQTFRRDRAFTFGSIIIFISLTFRSSFPRGPGSSSAAPADEAPFLFDFARSSLTSSSRTRYARARVSLMPLVSNNYAGTIESFHQSLLGLLSRIRDGRPVAACFPRGIIADALLALLLAAIADGNDNGVSPESITRSFS